MRRIALLIGMSFAMSIASIASIASAQGFSRSYWLVADNQRHQWCGYSDPSAYQAAAIRLKATQSAIVTYTLGKLTELTQQELGDNGNWIIIDRYTPSKGAVLLQRTNMLSRQNLRVVQTTSIHGSQAAPLRTVEVTTMQGQPVKPPANLALPAAAVMVDLNSAPYLLLVTQMRHEDIPTLCRRS